MLPIETVEAGPVEAETIVNNANNEEQEGLILHIPPILEARTRARSRNKYPIRVPWKNVVVELLLWPDYYRFNAWAETDFEQIQRHWNLPDNLVWVRRRALGRALGPITTPTTAYIYFQTYWCCVVYTNGLRAEERRRLRLYNYR